VCDVVNRTSETEEISPVGSTTGGGGVFSGVFKPERAKALLEPRIQTLFTAPIEQFSKHGIHERFEMVRVTYRRASKGVPDVGELAVFDAVEPNIRHPARLLRGTQAGSSARRLLLDSIAQRRTSLRAPVSPGFDRVFDRARQNGVLHFFNRCHATARIAAPFEPSRRGRPMKQADDPRERFPRALVVNEAVIDRAAGRNQPASRRVGIRTRIRTLELGAGLGDVE
jgi:hypothetical protein